jgi:zinc protease
MSELLRLHRAAAFALALATVLPCAPDPPRAAAGGIASAPRTILANGTEVIVIPQAGVPLVAVVAVVHAGASSETPSENGASHMLEHLLFNGTETRTQEQLDADLGRLGIFNNAHTGLDETTLFMLGPRQDVLTMLATETEMLFRSTFPPEKLEKERGIVRNEIAKDATQDETRIQSFVDEIFYRGTPCALPVTGTDASIGALTRDAILDYYRLHYRPGNVTVILMGDVDPEAALRQARSTFGEVAVHGTAPGSDPPACKPANRAAGFVHARGMAIASRHVAFVAAGPGPRDPLHAAAGILRATLEAGLAGAANERLAGPGGKILDASVELVSQRSGAALEVGATLDETLPYDGAAEALRAVLRERLAAPPDPDLLAESQVAERVSLALLEEKPHYFGLDRAPLISCCGWQAVVDEASTIAAVSPADVARVAAGLVDSRAWAVFYAGKDLPEVTTPAAIPPDATPPAAAAPSAAQAPPAAPPREVREILGNGLTVLVRSSRESGIFAAALIARGRAYREPETMTGIADLLHRLAGNATRSRSASHLERDLAKMGAKVKVTDDPAIPYDDADTTPEYSFVRMETLDEFAPGALSILAEMIREPALDSGSLDRMRGLEIARAGQAAARPGERARAMLLRGLLGSGSPLARSPFGSEATLRGITANDLESFRHRYFAPSNLILSIATALPPAGVLAEVTRTLGALESWEPSPISMPPAEPGPPAKVEEKTGAGQAYILEGAILKPRPEEVPRLAAAAAVLSKRMGMELREKRGLAYALGAGVEPFGSGLLFLVRMGTTPAQEEEALAGMEAQIRTLASRPPDEQEIAAATRTEGVRVLMRGLSRINRAFAAGLDELRATSALPAPWRDLPSVTPKEVAAAAKAYLSPAAMSRVVLE